MELSSFTASVTLGSCLLALESLNPHKETGTHMREFGFFFFFNMAVAVSST